MENLTGKPLHHGETYWIVTNQNTSKVIAVAITHQKAYGFITKAENEAGHPLPYLVDKMKIIKY